jgi:hypothetical protein
LVYRNLILTLLAVMLSCLTAMAGGSIFSANGNGEQVVGGGTRAQGLGGGAFGLADSMAFNTENPALAAFARRTVFRASGEATAWTTHSGGRRESDTDFQWKDFCLYFPVSSRWVVGAGAQPTRLMDLRTFDSLDAAFANEGTLGYQRRDGFRGSSVEIRVDNAYRVNDRFGLGLSVAYALQRYEHDRTFAFPVIENQSYYRSLSYAETQTYRAWSARLGAYFSPTPRLGLGVAFEPRNRGEWAYTFAKGGSDSTMTRSRGGDHPGDLSAGVSYLVSNRVRAVADVEVGQWQAGDMGIMADFAGADRPVNPLFVSVGMERIAGKAPNYTGLGTIGYRGGFYYHKNYWPEINGTTVDDIAATGGISIPVAGGDGWIHFAGELGLRGQNETKLGAREFFARGSLQLEISESWFQRAQPRQPK